MKKALSILLIMAAVILVSTVPAAAAMRNGSKGSDVTWYQKSLNYLGFNCGPADGTYGSQTAKATKDFQKQYGLAADGIAGSKTTGKVTEIIKEVQKNLTILGYGSLTADGLPGTKTIEATKRFQKAFGLTQTGICDSVTLQALNKAYEEVGDEAEDAITQFKENCMTSWTLPLKDKFEPITGTRVFGSSRASGTRAHAGIDFVAPAGTVVYAMTAGTVTRVYVFYENTQAVDVLNEDGSILRYCEIAPSVKVGDKLKQGDKVGTIKRATSNTEMLHLELYFGDASGALTQRDNKKFSYVKDGKNYQRRADLMDPTFLKDLKSLQ